MITRNIPSCPDGCMGDNCHCLSCGATGVELNEDGDCGNCVALDQVNLITEHQRYPFRSFVDFTEVLNWLRWAE